MGREIFSVHTATLMEPRGTQGTLADAERRQEKAAMMCLAVHLLLSH